MRLAPWSFTLLCVGTACGGTPLRTADVAPQGDSALAPSPEVTASADRGPTTVSADVAVAGASTCAVSPVSCVEATPCPARLAALALEESACAESTRFEDVATVATIANLVVSGERARVMTDRGVLSSSSAGWEPDSDPRAREGSVQMVFGADEWRMPDALELTECHQPTVQCRRGHPKCAMPRPECVPTAELVLAVHGPRGTRVTLSNSLTGAGGYTQPTRERLVAMVGTSASDVWVLSAARLFHWDGHAATETALDAEDPIVRLVSDPSGVYAATRSGRRMLAAQGLWQPLAEQPGPFLGQAVEAPAHPFVVLDDARATGPDAFWARGHVAAFGGRHDAAPALVRYEHGVYRTWVGALTQRTWLRASSRELDALRPEVFDVVVEDARYAPGMFPFVTVRWQEPRDLVRLPSGELLVATPTGLFGLSAAAWTREVGTAVDAIAASGELVAAVGDGTLQLREAQGWCPALRTAPVGGESLAVAHARAWLAAAGHLYSVDAAHAAEEWTLRVDGQDARVERLLADGLDVMAFARATDGSTFVTRFDGTAWSSATRIGTEPVPWAVGSAATEIRAGSARFDGRCWSHVTPREVPLLEVRADQALELELIGDEEAELVMRVVTRP